MRTVNLTEKIEIKVKPEDLLENHWLNFYLLSQKLGDIEKQTKREYKSLRNKFYNSCACKKYNTKDIAGLVCIDVNNPMKDKASLELAFIKE